MLFETLETWCNTSLLIDYVDENGAHKYILIDVGKTFREQVLRWFTHHKIPRVDSIILTHEHADAVLGLDDIRAVQPFSPTNEIDPTPIYLTQHAMESLAEKFPYLVKKKMKEGEEVRRVAQLDWRIIESDCAKPFISSGLEFVPLPVMHGEDYVCLGFLFGKKSRTAYISDVSRFPATTEHLISKAGGGQLDLLILDTLYKRLYPEAVDFNRTKLDRAIVAHLLGRRVSFQYLLSELQRQWFCFGHFDIITTGPRSFLCIFLSVVAPDAVLQRGPWLLDGSLIAMDCWTPTYSRNSRLELRFAIWVRLPHLPLLWDHVNLFRIASILGEPLWMDEHTSAWGRSSFARVCVRLDLTKRLRPGIWVDGISGRFFRSFQYEGLSIFCFHCGLVDHFAESCPNNVAGPSCPPPFAARRVPSPPMKLAYNALGFLFGAMEHLSTLPTVSLPLRYLLAGTSAWYGLLLFIPGFLTNLLFEQKGSHNTHFCLQQSLDAVNRIRPKQALFIGMTHEFDHHKDNKALAEWSNRW
ncbi:hypothetical protein M5K25_014781 [Dendrobium thyrsiflorum]|uniref:CCHC-type domain-containing protein n=1 Tax=Dendrobium thyrsiflorum TaxID=117978 RepID=A0ABD0UPE7_DENTH